MIEISNLNFAYHSTPVLQNVSLSIGAGEFTGIIGPNGAGKSTLLKLIAGIFPPRSGQITLHQKPLAAYQRKELARLIGYIPQEFKTAFNFSAYEIVLMGRYPYLSPFSNETEYDKQVIRTAMEETEVWALRERPFSELSGGERQRVVLASALAQQPQILLLDEPTAALDLKHQVRFYEILSRRDEFSQTLQRQKGLTVVIVTHDINLAARFCRRLLVMKEGKIVADGHPGEILSRPLMEAVYETSLEIISHPRDGKPLLLVG